MEQPGIIVENADFISRRTQR